jgi:hypothetical protein
MSDLGANAALGQQWGYLGPLQGSTWNIRTLRMLGNSDACEVMSMLDISTVPASGYDLTQGNPTAPSQRMRGGVTLRRLLVPVAAGARSISIDCKNELSEAPYPRILIKADHTLGIHADVEAVAASGSAWQTLTLNFTVRNAGVVEVLREKRHPSFDKYVWWDNVVVT